MSESTHLDLKISIDPSDKEAMLKLVKHLVAEANSGGGTVRIGGTELDSPGIAKDQISEFDGAKISDLINRYIDPGRASVSHRIVEIGADRAIVELTIDPAGKYPFVFSKQGLDNSKKGPVFRPGEIYVRHGAKSEPVTYSDIVAIIDRAVERSKQELYRNIGRLVELPNGFQPVYVEAPNGELLPCPTTLIDMTNKRREKDRSAMLDGNALLWCFSSREEIEWTDDRLSLAIRSGLRRPATLCFWLEKSPNDRFVEEILLSTLDDLDRDKSDAKNTLLEVAAIFASDRVVETLVSRMGVSSYSHFRNAAKRWKGRADAIASFLAGANSTWNGAPLRAMPTETLYRFADALAEDLLSKKNQRAKARSMRDLGREVLRRRRGLQTDFAG